MNALRTRLIALLALMVVTAGAASAQFQNQTYRGTTRSVRQLILRIENRTDIFRNTINAQNRTRIYRTQDLNTLAQDLDTAVVRLRERFDRRQSTAADAQEVLNRAAEIDRLVNVRNIRANAILQSWTNLRVDLNQLATVYSVTWPTVGQPIRLIIFQLDPRVTV